ncbi:MAG: helix-turn-helix transcriptional regulator [Clostridia bacterium]|nr:helix-turn-helix transcriptional regulator [Clostridia bacterium]
MTQEELAELLGVSTSAVSLWESGKTMPDIATVPAICAVLEVSADELFGIDRERREAEIDAIVAEARKAGDRGYCEEALAVIEAGLKRYPDSWKLQYNAMRYHNQLHNRDGGDTVHRDKTIELGERILKKCTEEGYRASATQLLCFLYRDSNPERAEQLLNTMGTIWASRDVLATKTLKGDKQLEAIHSMIESALDLMTNYMPSDVKLDSGERRYTRAELEQIYMKIIVIFETLFEDGDPGFYHERIYRAHDWLADYYADNKDAGQTLSHLERAAYHAVEFVKFAKYGRKEFVNTSLVFRGHNSGGFTTNSSKNNAQSALDSMSHPRYDFIRDTPEFAAISAKLAPYAGDWAKRE